MKFQFYISDLFDGTVTGTNDETTAKTFAESYDFHVVDAHAGEWLRLDGTRAAVEEISIELVKEIQAIEEKTL